MYKEIQLTHDASGHCLNSTQCFSPDDQWIVYDGRNHDTMIGSTGLIAMVNTFTGEIRKLYEVPGQSEWGPGVGAATFSPVSDRVMFIHGIRNASEEKPYSITRRTGVAIDLARPQTPIFLDARDVVAPFTNGALRGGTHAHTWSADGDWISFTYNDAVVSSDLRTVGIMVPGRQVIVSPDENGENNSGEMFALLAVPVVASAAAGSDEIEKAFDETWIGRRRAIAFQGHVRDEHGALKTEIFVAEIPESIVALAAGTDLRGTTATLPVVPDFITHRRLTFTSKGVSAAPRHWLRSNAGGSLIAFLAQDHHNHIQLFGVSPDSGEVTQITHHDFSIKGPFNFSPDGKWLAYPADNSVFITEVSSGKSERITPKTDENSRPVGAVNWSNNGKMLCYNRYVDSAEGLFLQVFLITVFG
jgi:Tol biopolymer transport system component